MDFLYGNSFVFQLNIFGAVVVEHSAASPALSNGFNNINAIMKSIAQTVPLLTIKAKVNLIIIASYPVFTPTLLCP